MNVKQAWFIIHLVYCYVEYMVHLLCYVIGGGGDMEEEPVVGKVAIVTGSNTGLGKQVATELADRRATVILACRNLVAGRNAVEDIKAAVQFAKVELMELDLSDLDSVRKFVSQVKFRYPEIHLLVNNAGVASFRNETYKTKHGFELHMGVNHLGHFLLTNLLLDNLKAGAPSRIVNVSSSTMLLSNLKLDDLNMERFRNPTASTGVSRMPYNNSKMANALFSKELGIRLEGTGVNVYSVCPGLVRTDVFRDAQSVDKFLTNLMVAVGGVSIGKGAKGVLYCALSRKVEHETGKFYRFEDFFRRANARLKVRDAQELWSISERLVSLKNL